MNRVIVDNRIIKLARAFGYVVETCYNESHLNLPEGIDQWFLVLAPKGDRANVEALRRNLTAGGFKLAYAVDDRVTVIL